MVNTTRLSKKEKAVSRLLLEGKSNKQIAADLHVSTSTVEFHLTNVYKKLGVSSSKEAIIQLGMLGESPGLEEDENDRKDKDDQVGDSGKSPVEISSDEPDNKGVSISSAKEIPGMTLKSNHLLGTYRMLVIVGMLVLLTAFLVIHPPVLRSTNPPGIGSAGGTTAASDGGVISIGIGLSPKVKVSRGIDLPTPLANPTLTRLRNGRILIAGGFNGSEHVANVQIFDPLKNVMAAVHPLGTQRGGHSATLLGDGRVLVVGGYNAEQGWLEDAEIYDPAKDSWTVIAPLHPHGVSHTATLMGDGRVLVVGGCIGDGVCTNQVDIFDPQTNSWTDGMPLQSERASQTAQLLNDGRVLVAGGDVTDSSTLLDGNATIYDPQTNTWSATGPMITARVQAESVLLPNGNVLVAGGILLGDPQNRTILASTEIYHPASNTWTAASSLRKARYDFVMSLLGDSRVVVVGGARDYDTYWSANSFVHQIELYDPGTNRWQEVWYLGNPTVSAAAVLLSDGRLWVAGGQSDHTTYWSNTWMIRPTWPAPE